MFGIMSSIYLFTISKQKYKECNKVSYYHTCPCLEDQSLTAAMPCILSQCLTQNKIKILGLHPSLAMNELFDSYSFIQ